MGNNQTTEQKKKTIVSIEDDGFITRTWPPVGKINIKYSDGTTEERECNLVEAAELRFNSGLMNKDQYDLIVQKYEIKEKIQYDD